MNMETKKKILLALNIGRDYACQAAEVYAERNPDDIKFYHGSQQELLDKEVKIIDNAIKLVGEL